MSSPSTAKKSSLATSSLVFIVNPSGAGKVIFVPLLVLTSFRGRGADGSDVISLQCHRVPRLQREKLENRTADAQNRDLGRLR